MSCFVIPFLLPIAWPCFRACDREALTKAHNIEDGIGYCGACLLSWIGLGGCLLCQELITIKQQQLAFNRSPQQQQQTVVIMQAPPQQAMPRACRRRQRCRCASPHCPVSLLPPSLQLHTRRSSLATPRSSPATRRSSPGTRRSSQGTRPPRTRGTRGRR